MKLFLRQTDGLGNQLFQYAAGRYFSRVHNAQLQVIRDPIETSPSGNRPRPFMLTQFRISAPVRDRKSWDRLVCAIDGYKARLGAMARLISRTQLHQQQLQDAWIFQKALNIKPFIGSFYLKGYFQAHQFAAAVEAELRKEFQFKAEPTGKNLETRDAIFSSAMPVSLHMRRGDYTKLNGGQLALPVPYYSNAICEVRKRLPNASFFVFSDDITFARLNLEEYGDMVFVDHNDEAHGYEDLRLMSSCRHHIIANSTLSWWGAWLNPDPDKLVFAPDRWLMPEYPHTDLIPSTWIRLATTSPTEDTDVPD